MDKKKRAEITESDKEFLRSLHWVTNVLNLYFEADLAKDEELFVKEKLKSIDCLSDASDVKLTENQLSKSDKRIKKKVFDKLNLLYPEGEKAESLLPPKPKRPFIVTFRKYVAVAAVFVFAFGLSYFMLFNEHSLFENNLAQSMSIRTTLLQTGVSGIKEIVLPDGTKLCANADTRIDYDKDQFNKKKREIWLEGEAFFEVAKNPEKPFIIHTRNIQTMVRGTSFNVKAYKEIGEISVTVRTGKVQVGTGGATFGTLTHNKQLSYNEKTDKHTIAESNWEDAVAWKERRLVLNNANISELKLRIKQLYHVEIIVEGNILDNESFGLSFNANASLTDVMNVIEQLYDIRYKKNSSGKIYIYRN